ncbi:MAG: BamA/TamA family outer membrane protein [Bacteroidota bacterium]|nr:BamA/TamA family outer membrane protein [Bacteroidota bacterium]
MYKFLTKLVNLFFLTLLFGNCSGTRILSTTDYVVDKNEIYEDGILLKNDPINFVLKTKSNKKIIGIPLKKILFKASHPNPEDQFKNWLDKKDKRRKRLENLISNKQIRALNNYAIKFNNWLKKTGEAPTIYDSLDVKISKDNIIQYYKNLGYFNVEVESETEKINQRKLILKYKINPNERYLIDSITTSIESPELSILYDENKTDQIINKGEPFEIKKFEDERERLFTIFRNNGVYNFQQNSIQFTASIDSTGKDLKIPVNIKIANIQKRLNDSIINLPYKKYKIKGTSIFINNENKISSQAEYDHSITFENFKIYSNGKLKYNPKAITSGISIREGEFYSDLDRNLTYRYFTNLKNFKYPNINYTLLSEKDNELNTTIILNPKERFSLGFDLDLSHSNIQDFGIGLGGGLGIRNVFRGAEILEINIQNTLGASKDIAKIGEQFFNIFELGADIKLSVARLLFPPFNKDLVQSSMYPKTEIVFGSSLQKNVGLDKQFFKVNYQFDWKPNNKKRVQFKLIDLEFINNRNISNYFNVFRNSYDRLNNIAKQTSTNQSLIDTEGNLNIPDGANNFIFDVLNNNTNLTFEDEEYKTVNTLKERYDRLTANNLILGSSLSLNTNSQESIFDENFYQFRWKIDLIGNLLRLFLKSINANQNETNYYTLGGVSPSQYIKTEIDYIKHWSLGRERIFAFHAFTGIAIPYGNSSNVPFARSYFSGGSNDNRAWRAYELGPGSSNNINEFNEANFKLAFNLEYRFPISGPLNGGLFIDIGNIWNLWDNVNDTAMSFSGLKDLNELAIGSGFGLRYDFDFFVFRFDTGFKTYNPALSVGQRWWSEFNLRNAVLNIGINYPF